MVYLLGAIIGLIWVWLCLKNWRTGIYLVFFIMCVDGAIRRYFVDSILIYFIKDISLFLTYISFLIESKKIGRKIFFENKLNILFVLLFLLTIIQMFNPNLGNFKAGLVGAKLILFYIPLFYLAYYYFDSKKKLIKFLYFLLILAIPVCIFGIVQFLIGPISSVGIGEEFQPWFATSATHELIYRPESTLAATGLFAAYISIMSIISISLINVKDRKMKILSLISIFFVLLAGVINASKAFPTAFAIFLIFVIFIFRKTFFIMKLLLIFFVIILISFLFFPKALDNSMDRIMQMVKPSGIHSDKEVVIMSNPFGRAIESFKYGIWLWSTDRASIFGNGAGKSAIGIRYLLSERERYSAENYYLKIILELGVQGLILFSLLIASIISTGIKIYINLKDDDLKWISIGFLGCIISIFSFAFTTNILDHAIVSIFLYFSVGGLFRLPLLDT